VQGLRGHQRWRHGSHYSMKRRYWTKDGRVIQDGWEGGLTLMEAVEQARWEQVLGRLENMERTLSQIQWQLSTRKV